MVAEPGITSDPAATAMAATMKAEIIDEVKRTLTGKIKAELLERDLREQSHKVDTTTKLEDLEN